MSTRRRVSRAPVVVGCVIAVCLLLLTGLGVWNYGRNAYWWGTSDRMRVLLSDPMASTALLGLPLLSHEQTEPVGLTGKPNGDFVTNVFASKGGTIQQTQSSVVQEAERVGWTPNPTSSSPLSQNFSRNTQDGASLLLSVAPLFPGDQEIGDQPGVRVALSYA